MCVQGGACVCKVEHVCAWHTYMHTTYVDGAAKSPRQAQD